MIAAAQNSPAEIAIAIGFSLLLIWCSIKAMSLARPKPRKARSSGRSGTVFWNRG